MKKFILPIFFSIFFLPMTSSSVYAQSADCWEEFSDVMTICGQAVSEQRPLGKCDQIISTFHTCLGVDKNPWKVQASKPGHLNCKEWKDLSIVGTAQNCVAPVTDTFEKKLWCLSSAAEISQVRSHPVDYILDFDPNSCILTEDDVRQFKANLPSTSGSLGIPQSQTNNKGTNNKKNSPSPFNIFGINPYQTWLNIQELVSARAFMATGGLERFTETTILHGVGKVPSWEKDAKEMGEINKFYDQASERLLKLKGKTDWTDINDTTKKILIEAAGGPVTAKKGSALIDLQPQSGEKGVLETGDKPTLKSGAVDVIVKPQEGQQFQMQTPNAEILVIGTEFSVIYDQKLNKTLVAVYKGKVEVKAKDGKITQVSPNGDKPEVLVVAQKLSVVKFAIAGAVLASAIVGAILILKKRFSLKSFKKRR